MRWWRPKGPSVEIPAVCRRASAGKVTGGCKGTSKVCKKSTLLHVCYKTEETSSLYYLSPLLSQITTTHLAANLLLALRFSP
jgi:hypothetical protein